jgi:hypothetical protein
MKGKAVFVGDDGGAKELASFGEFELTLWKRKERGVRREQKDGEGRRNGETGSELCCQQMRSESRKERPMTDKFSSSDEKLREGGPISMDLGSTAEGR